jgi:hypothetical protein
LAVIVSILLLALAASPFWTPGILKAMPYPAAAARAAWVVNLNPFYAATGAVVERTRFLWHEQSNLLYDRIGLFAIYPAPPIRWYAPVIFLGPAAAVLALTACGLALLRQANRQTVPRGPRSEPCSPIANP